MKQIKKEYIYQQDVQSIYHVPIAEEQGVEINFAPLVCIYILYKAITVLKKLVGGQDD